MRSVILTVGLVMLLAVSSVAIGPANVLIVDRTQSFMESMQVDMSPISAVHIGPGAWGVAYYYL